MEIHSHYSTSAEKSQEGKCAVFLKNAAIGEFLAVRRRGKTKSSPFSGKKRDRGEKTYMAPDRPEECGGGARKIHILCFTLSLTVKC